MIAIVLTSFCVMAIFANELRHIGMELDQG